MKKNLIICFFAISCAFLFSACSSSSSDPTPPINVEFDGATLSEVQRAIKGKWRLTKRSESKDADYEEFPNDGKAQEIITFNGNRFLKEISIDGGNDYSSKGQVKLVWKEKQVLSGKYHCFTPNKPEKEEELIPVRIKDAHLSIIRNTIDGGESIYVRYDK